MAGIKVNIIDTPKSFKKRYKICAACKKKKKIISHTESNYTSGYSDSASSYSASSDSDSEGSDESLSSVSSSVSDSWKS